MRNEPKLPVVHKVLKVHKVPDSEVPKMPNTEVPKVPNLMEVPKVPDVLNMSTN
jgi:hypothetical protein